jgi:hypothetical protein
LIHILLQSRLQFLHAHHLCQILEENLDEDTTAGCSFFFVEVHNREDMPSNGIGSEEMAEETCDIAKAIRLVPVDGIIVLREGLLKQICPKPIDFGEPFANETIKFGEGAFLGAALNNHRGQFWLLPRRKRNFHQLVTALLRINT